MNTLLLDTVAWDLCLDAGGNMALATEPYALAQDAACACKLFRGEYWYDTTLGVPWLQQLLGVSPPPMTLIKQLLTAAALTVPDVTEVLVFLTNYDPRTRVLGGQVQVYQGNAIVAVTDFTI